MDISSNHPVIFEADWGQCSGCQVASCALNWGIP